MRSSWRPWPVCSPLGKSVFGRSEIPGLRISFWKPGIGNPGICDPGIGDSAFDDREDVILAHQEDLLVAAELELIAGVGGEDDAVADLDLQLAALAVLGDPAIAD